MCHRAFHHGAKAGNIKIYLTEYIQNWLQIKPKGKQSVVIVKQEQNQIQSLSVFVWKNFYIIVYSKAK